MANLKISQHDQHLQALLNLIKIEADKSDVDVTLLACFTDPDFGYNVLEVRQLNAHGESFGHLDKILWIDVEQQHGISFVVSFSTEELSARYEKKHIGAQKREWLDEQIFKLARFVVDYLTGQPTHIDPLNGKG